MQLNNARILLTGATGGLGEALAHALTVAGAQLLIAGRDTPKLSALCARLNCTSVRADITRPEGIAALTGAAREFKINLLINNAGIGHFGLYDEQSWPTVDQLIATNLSAPMQLTHALLPWLKAQDAAAIVNIGSTFGTLPFAGFVAYSATKAGLRGFSQGLRRELADSAVRVVHIAPRAIDTALNSAQVNALNEALGNANDAPSDVADIIVETLQTESNERHIGFPERVFAWLNRAFPSLIDRALKSKLATIKHYAKTSRTFTQGQP
jgi:short-subunit dehydrogenase